ncbi:MAG: Gfo/Idh/MocA family oxidoreductase [Acidobacteria bacterium]|nr:Gfo/Idh/MocA family oxidoreductase [Acidobacteriota bacterium]
MGRIGMVHFEAWQRQEGARVAAVCDPSETTRAAAEAQGMTAFSDPDEMLAQVKLDAVSICAPPSLHQPLAEVCFTHRVPVLCEKPLATEGDSASKLVESAHRLAGRFQLATKFRHVPELQMAR